MVPSTDLPRLLALHGFGSGGYAWEKLAHELGEYTIDAVDIEELGGTANGRSVAGDVVDQLMQREAGKHSPPVAVLGHSLGAALAAEMLRRSQSQDTPLVAVSPFVPSPQARLLMDLLAPARPGRPRTIRGRVVENLGAAHPRLRRIRSEQREVKGISPAIRFAAAISEFTSKTVGRAALQHVQDSGSDAFGGRQVLNPTLVIIGSRDRIQRRRTTVEWAVRYPAVQVHIIEGGGHSPHMTQSSTVAEHIRNFLQIR